MKKCQWKNCGGKACFRLFQENGFVGYSCKKCAFEAVEQGLMTLPLENPKKDRDLLLKNLQDATVEMVSMTNRIGTCRQLAMELCWRIDECVDNKSRKAAKSVAETLTATLNSMLP